MSNETYQKAVPSQETKSSWLHPSAVELVIHNLRINAQAKPKVVISRANPNKSYRLKESAPNEGRPKGGFLKASKVDDARPNGNSLKGNKLDGYRPNVDFLEKNEEDDARPSGEPLNLDDAKPNKRSSNDNGLADDIRPEVDLATAEDEEDAYRVELEELKYRGRWALLLDKQTRDENKMTQQDRAWLKIDELCERGLLSYATTSTLLCKAYPCTEELGCIWCFTNDYRDEHDVRIRAGVIRKALALELGEKDIIYVIDKAAWLLSRHFTLSKASLYRQTEDYKFWKKGSGESWCLVRGTIEGAIKSTVAEFRKAIPSRVRILPFIEPSVVEQEKYIVRQKAKCTDARIKFEKSFDEDINNSKDTNLNYSKPVKFPPPDKEMEEIKNVNFKTSESTFRDGGFIGTKSEDNKPECYELGDTIPRVGEKMKQPKLELGGEAYEYNHIRHRDGFYDERNITNGLKDVKPNCRGPIDPTACKDLNIFETESNYTKPEGSSVCSTVDNTRTDDRKADDTGTDDSKQDQLPCQKDDHEDLLSLVEYLELEDSYLDSAQDDENYLIIWAMYFNRVTHRDLKRKSKDEERVKDVQEEWKQEVECEDQGKGIAEGNEDGKEGKRNLKAKDEGEQEDYEGMWILLFDKKETDTNMLTQLDRAWYKIDDLCENGFLQFGTVSTAVVNRYPCSKSVGCIRCHTEDYRDVEDVRWRGDVIREALKEELGQTVIYYVKKTGNEKRYLGLENASIYRHTPDYCFWEPDDDDVIGGWELIPRINGLKRARTKDADHEIVPSRVTYDEYLHSPTPDCETLGSSGGPDPLKSTHASLQKYTFRKETLDTRKPNCDLLKPDSGLSKSTDPFSGGTEYRPSCSSSDGKDIRLNCSSSKTEQGTAELEDPGQSEKELYGGKWMVFLDCVERDHNGHTLLDRAWFKIEDLCLEKRLVSAYVSTAKETIYDQSDNKGCICCCTEDYRNKGDVRRKGYLIRKTLQKELRNLTIYYKTDAATFEGKFSVFGHKRICIYRQKPDCSLWEKLEGPPFWKVIF